MRSSNQPFWVVSMVILLTWNTKNSWTVSITPYTAWLFFSWLLCYPWLRGKLGHLFIKNDKRRESYDPHDMDRHRQGKSVQHKNRELTANGMTSYPWQYAIGSTRSIGEIFSLIYVFCEHLLMSALLILFGPLITCTLLLITLFKKRRS